MDIVMPQLGETVAEGTISNWFKAAGDRVEAGENLFEIETDKVTMEVQAITSGVLSEIRVDIGETAPVGAVVAVIGDAAAASAPAAKEAPAKASAAPTPAAPVASAPAAPPQASSGNGAFKIAPFAETNTPTGHYGKASAPNGLKITPLARRLIAQSGIDVAGLTEAAKARGAWRIAKADVLSALEQRSAPPSSAPAPQAARAPAPAPRTDIAGERTPFNTIRRQTAERLQHSWQTVPHVFQAVEVDFANVDKVRRAKKEAFQARHGVGLTYLPFIARAVVMAIADYPRVNARLDGDGLVLARAVNLGIAVDLSHEGLVVPVLKGADDLTVAGIAKAVARLAERARTKALTPDDFADGTYTISNNGSFGTLFTAPIINPPQVAILSTDAVRKKPVVIESEAGDSIAVHPVGVVAQSFDHRAFDGAYSAAFLKRLKEALETHDWAAELA